MPSNKFYVVWKGRIPGIYTTWEACKSQVTGFTGARYKSFKNRAEATKAFSTGREDPPPATTPMPIPLLRPETSPPIAESYCVDSSCLGNPGWMEYRCVHTTTHVQLFHQGPFENGTNNIGEFLAIVHALSSFKTLGWTTPLYTDSKIAILWVGRKKCKTLLIPDESNAPVFELIAWAEDWLANNQYQTPVLKWKTHQWGEIPADFGRKRPDYNPTP